MTDINRIYFYCDLNSDGRTDVMFECILDFDAVHYWGFSKRLLRAKIDFDYDGYYDVLLTQFDKNLYPHRLTS